MIVYLNLMIDDLIINLRNTTDRLKISSYVYPF